MCRLLWRCPCLILFLELLVFGGMSAGMLACHIEIDVGIDSFEIGADHSSVRQRNALAAAQREWGEKLDSAVAAQNAAGGHAPFRHLLWDDGAQRLSRHFSVWEEAARRASRSGAAVGGTAAGGGNRGLARRLSRKSAQPWGAGGGGGGGGVFLGATNATSEATASAAAKAAGAAGAAGSWEPLLTFSNASSATHPFADDDAVAHPPQRRRPVSGRGLGGGSPMVWQLLARLEVAFEDRAGGSVLTEDHFKSIHAVERAVQQRPDYSNYCFLGDRKGTSTEKCQPPNSLLTYFYATLDKNGGVQFDGRGDSMPLPFEIELAEALNHKEVFYYLDDSATALNKDSAFVKSVFMFATPHKRDTPEYEAAHAAFLPWFDGFVDFFEDREAKGLNGVSRWGLGHTLAARGSRRAHNTAAHTQ